MRKNCKQCLNIFEITDENLRFYQKISPVIGDIRYDFPAPGLCPACRYQRRLLQRNERKLYKRKCVGTGELIVSIFSEDKPMPVYKHEYWWGDSWEAMDYAREVDFGKPFMEQFKDLLHCVPAAALNNARSINCEFTNQSQNNNNCYFITCSNQSEHCFFCMWIQNALNCADCLYLKKGELCYEVINANSCYNVKFSDNATNCSDSWFLKNCIGCKNCFGCVNLRNKEYYFFNEKLSKKEYEEKVAMLGLETNHGIEEMRNKFDEFCLRFPNKFYHGAQIENSNGDYIQEVKNSFYCFNCRYSEDIQYCQDAWEAKNCYDLTETFTNDVCLEVEGSVSDFNCAFCMKIDNSYDCFYSSHCYSCKNCFGCAGLRNKEYCILNKQYTKEEYESLVPRIIESMRADGSWGEHFSPSVSPFAYNETVAQEYFPLTHEEALTKGYKWRATENSTTANREGVIICKVTGRSFKLIPQEIELYKKLRLPAPEIHPDERHRIRMNRRNSRALWQRKCMQCKTNLWTSYAPDSKNIIYCEKCYLESVG